MLAFKYFNIFHIPWWENARADTLSRLATLANNTLDQTYVEFLETPSIKETEEVQ